jgi:predicted transcriptional regulator
VTEKDRILQALAELPEDATIDDAIERLYLLLKIERGIDQANSGRLIRTDEVRARLQQWLP